MTEASHKTRLGMFTASPDGRVLAADPGASALLGEGALAGRSLGELVFPGARSFERWLEALGPDTCCYERLRVDARAGCAGWSFTPAARSAALTEEVRAMERARALEAGRTAARPQAGGRRPPGRRGGPRLQQPAHGDPHLGGDGADR